MNIFCTNPLPSNCILDLDDKRLNKMILESAMLLSDALHKTDFPDKEKICYPCRQKNNPWLIWTRQNKKNYSWILTYFLQCIREFRFRHDFNKRHSFERMSRSLFDGQEYMSDGELQPFINQCRKPTKGFDFTMIKDVHLAYKMYLKAKWMTDNYTPRWTNRNKPEWYDSIVIDITQFN